MSRVGDKDLVLVSLRKHLPSVEADAQSGYVCPELHNRRDKLPASVLPPELRVSNVFPMTIREAEVYSCTWCVVQLVRREVFAQQIAAVVGEPKCVGLRVPVEAHGVSDAAGENLKP